MAWVKLYDGDPWLEVDDDGHIRWDYDAQRLLGCPDWVELFYDATVPARLGLRKMDFSCGFATRVRDCLDDEVMVANAVDVLTENGLLPAKTYEVVPQTAADMPGLLWWYIPT